jgi:hypothetical protein
VLEKERVQLLDLQQQAARADKSAPAAAPQPVNASQAVNAPRAAGATHVQPKRGYMALVPIVAGLGILSAALAAIYVKFRRRTATMKPSRNDGVVAAGPAPADAVAADSAAADGMPGGFHEGTQDLGQELAQERAQGVAPTCASDGTQADAGAPAAAADGSGSTHPMLPALSEPAGRSEIAAGASSRAVPQDPTVNLHVHTANLRMDPTRLDYNFLDLDLTAQHVQMPSVLNEHAVVRERRTNLADVLKMAIEREPDRHDLRMKLLELYYSAAVTNRKAFLEVVQKFARDRDYLNAEQWDRIAQMGRQIASDNPMFTEEPAADDDLADCA